MVDATTTGGLGALEFPGFPEFRGSGVPGFRVLEFWSSGVPGFRGSGVPGFRGSGVPGFRGSGVPGFRGSRGSGVPGVSEPHQKTKSSDLQYRRIAALLFFRDE
ncbi:hypothetical protein M2109_005282 [Paenibacillus sp. PastH-3]|nr:hypothetical protein [Paenibacillus sp. PastH-4]MDH6446631.1 hypothetical protein [Paenibacillus sp. PastF-4]MDH6530911.1 hypothetical protein [Paenibacillus sp. PastH-3]